jgi:GTP-binding protein
VVWLLDIRHQPSADDREIQRLLVDSGRPVLAVFTKADKLTRSRLTPRVRDLAEALGLQQDQVQLTSSHSKLGISELATSIVAAAGGETP